MVITFSRPFGVIKTTCDISCKRVCTAKIIWRQSSPLANMFKHDNYKNWQLSGVGRKLDEWGVEAWTVDFWESADCTLCNSPSVNILTPDCNLFCQDTSLRKKNKRLLYLKSTFHDCPQSNTLCKKVEDPFLRKEKMGHHLSKTTILEVEAWWVPSSRSHLLNFMRFCNHAAFNYNE